MNNEADIFRDESESERERTPNRGCHLVMPVDNGTVMALSLSAIHLAAIIPMPTSGHIWHEVRHTSIDVFNPRIERWLSVAWSRYAFLD